MGVYIRLPVEQAATHGMDGQYAPPYRGRP